MKQWGEISLRCGKQNRKPPKDVEKIKVICTAHDVLVFRRMVGVSVCVCVCVCGVLYERGACGHLCLYVCAQARTTTETNQPTNCDAQ